MTEFRGNHKAQQNKRLFLQCYMHSGGNISLASENAGVSRQHVYSWLKGDVGFKKAKEQVDWGMVRFATSKLLQKAKNGDVKALIALKHRSEKRVV